MKRNNWRNAGCLTTIVAVVVVILLMVYGGNSVLGGISGRAAMILIWLPMLVPTVFFVGWAWKNESHISRILQTIGVVMTFLGVTFLWYTLWDPQMTWTLPVPLSTVSIIYVAAIFLCFVLAASPEWK
ncbi:MAG: hypothetical protein Q4D42_06630 [Eubacteriales bacterium]|nr:hypothetical protein [Eubacteriales bacterium]